MASIFKQIASALVLLALLTPAISPAQAPTDNPYLTLYPTAQKHWTQHIKWGQVLNARKVVGLLLPNDAVDSVVLAQTLDSLSQKNGGVLFFPPGVYYFHFDVTLPEGVVLRGTPQKNKLSAFDKNFKPLTRFVFPKYEVAAGQQVPIATTEGLLPTSLPRTIKTKKGDQKHFGLVYLDIDRAIVNFSNKPFGEPVTERDLRHAPQQLLLFGLRLNNAALPAPDVPTAFQRSKGHDWQRWPWKAVANINVSAEKNCVIANCLINSQPTDNFRQNDYMMEDEMSFDGFEALFKMTDHPAIAINYPHDKKKNSAQVDNLEIRDNSIWVSAGNVPIQVASKDIDSSNNVCRFIDEKPSISLDGKTASAGIYPYDLVVKNLEKTLAFTYHHANGDSMAYRLIPPLNQDPNQRYPLVLFLHDYTERGRDNVKQLRRFLWQLYNDDIRQRFPCYILAPQLPDTEEFWKAKYNFSSTWPLESCVAMVQQSIQNFKVDPQKCYVIGIGTGASATWDIAFHYPDVFAALAPLGGFFRFSNFSAKHISQHPMYIVWGDSDEYISTRGQRFMTTDMKTAGVAAKTKVFPNTGKKCWNRVLTDMPDFFPWLFAQRKSN